MRAEDRRAGDRRDGLLAGIDKVGVVSRIITDLAVMDVTPLGLKVVETAPGVSREQLQAKTGVPLH